MVNRKLEVYYPEGVNVNVIPVNQKYLKEEYIRFFQEDIRDLASDKDFDGQDLRITLAIISNLGYQNIFNLSHRELAEQLRTPRPKVTKTINKLVKKDYLRVVGKQGKQNIYMFNPEILFKSRARNFEKLKKAWSNKEVFTNTKKTPIDIDSDLDIDLENKLDDKVSELSQQFGVPKSKIKQIILSLVNQALDKESE